MRNLIIVGMLGVAAFMAGWFTINRDGENTIIEFNRAEIRQDTRRVIEKGREVLDRREPLDQQQGYNEQAAQSYPPQPSFPGSTGQQPYDSRGVGQPASYSQPTYPPASYQPVPNQYPRQPYQPQPYQAQPTPYQGQAAQYPPQPQSAYPRR